MLPEKARRALRRRYREPWRLYHGEGHLDDLLRQLGGLRPAFADPLAAEFAVWYHDAVYVPWETGNEAASARLMRTELEALVPEAEFAAVLPSVAAAEAMILATERHRVPEGMGGAQAGDCALFLDMDLRILGAGPEVYDRYEAGIAGEYVPVYGEDAYRRGRAKALKGFMERPRLYLTPQFASLEPAARGNLSRAIRALEPGLA